MREAVALWQSAGAVSGRLYLGIAAAYAGKEVLTMFELRDGFDAGFCGKRYFSKRTRAGLSGLLLRPELRR